VRCGHCGHAIHTTRIVIVGLHFDYEMKNASQICPRGQIAPSSGFIMVRSPLLQQASWLSGFPINLGSQPGWTNIVIN
jgi:hypothetical protein